MQDITVTFAETNLASQIPTNCKRPKRAFPQALIRFIDWETLAKNRYTEKAKLEWDFLANTTTQTNYTVKLI